MLSNFTLVNKKILFNFILFFLTLTINAFEIKPNEWYDFEGTLGKSKINLSIYMLEDNSIVGNYCYNKFDTKISISGQIVNNEIRLATNDENSPFEEFTGFFKTENVDLYIGTWTNANKTLPFSLTLQSSGRTNLYKRYNDFYGADYEVERFMKNVKTAIIKKDKIWLSKHINFPISVAISGKKRTIIKNKTQFIANFDKIFHPDYTNRVKNACTCNMFSNYQGAMIGNGIIWIQNTIKSTESNFDFEVIAINN